MKEAIPILISFLLASGGQPALGDIIDRIVAVVGRNAITQSEVEREARLEALFNNLPPDAASGNTGKREVLERLIRQQLVWQEMQQTTFPTADEAQVKKWLDEMRPKGVDPAAYGLREKDLADYARRQIDTLRFVELRFKPGLQIPPEQIETYYERTLVPELRRKGAGKSPPLEEVRGQIEQILVEERVNELLDAWLAELRTRVNVQLMKVDRP